MMPSSGLQGKPWETPADAEEFLRKHNYRFDPWYVIRPPVGKKDLINATDLEYRAVLYLVHEWDYGYEEGANENMQEV
jgi:hypothetical protein